MSKHTPGPWFAASEGSYKVASVTSNTGIYADTLPEAAQIAADARLIAAAPELLEFAQWVLSLKTGGMIEARARAVVAKAGGSA
jgi:hypothetical protein